MMLVLTSTDSLCIKVYDSDSLTNHGFVVDLGLSFGEDRIHVVSDESNTIPPPSRRDSIEHKYIEMEARMPEHAQHMNKVRAGGELYGEVCSLPRTTRILQVLSVVWRSSRMNGVKLRVFHNPGFDDVSGEWTVFIECQCG